MVKKKTTKKDNTDYSGLKMFFAGVFIQFILFVIGIFKEINGLALLFFGLITTYLIIVGVFKFVFDN